MQHSVSTSVVLPAPTTFDLINGVAVATNVAPSPAPVAGQVEWAYIVKIVDTHGKTFEYMVGVPDGTTEINFNVLPRYYETKPPLFGAGPQGIPGSAATVTVGTVSSGPTPSVTNTGTNKDAVLNFTLAKGDKGDTGVGVTTHYLGKMFTDAPSTYPVGISVGLYRTSDGWPTDGSAGHVNVATFLNATFTTGYQLITGYLSGKLLQYRVTASASTWGPLMAAASDALASPLLNGLMPALDKAKLDGATPLNAGVLSLVRRNSSGGYNSTDPIDPYNVANKRYVDSAVVGVQTVETPEMYGAVGDGATDDSDAIENAINANLTTGKRVLFASNRIYRITRPIISRVPTLGEKLSVDIGSTGSTPATITMDNNGHRHFEFAGAEFAPTTLTQTVKLQRRGWPVQSSSSFSEGMLMSVISSLPWFYDPRPETSDARISELHRVAGKEGSTLLTEAPSVDGYNTTSATVEVFPIQPIQVFVRNLKLTRPKPAQVAADADLTYVGIRVDFAVDSVIEDLIVENACSVGIQYRRSYNSVSRNNIIRGTNAYGSGYAFTLQGCSYSRIEGAYITETRRATDVTVWGKIISRHCTVDSNTYVGGGKNVRGNWMGWDPVTGADGTRNGGFGSHGVSDHTIVRNNLTTDCWEPYVVRGSNNIYENNTHIGNTRVAVFGLDSGGGTNVINGNKVLAGWLGTDKYASLANVERARDFLRLGNGLHDNSRVIVTDNYAEVETAFILTGNRLGSTSKFVRFLSVSNNQVSFASTLAAPGVLLDNPSGVLEAIGSGRYWTVGPNRLQHDGFSPTQTTRDINISGAKVLDYSTSGATT